MYLWKSVYKFFSFFSLFIVFFLLAFIWAFWSLGYHEMAHIRIDNWRRNSLQLLKCTLAGYHKLLQHILYDATSTNQNFWKLVPVCHWFRIQNTGDTESVHITLWNFRKRWLNMLTTRHGNVREWSCIRRPTAEAIYLGN